MNRLKEIREARGMSQMRLAEASGVTRQRIIQIESDPDANVTTETMRKLAEAMQVKESDIFFSQT